MSRNSLAQPGESASQNVSKVSSSRQLLGMAMTASSQRSASGLLMLKMAAVRRTRQWSGGGGAKVGRDVKVDSVVDGGKVGEGEEVGGTTGLQVWASQWQQAGTRYQGGKVGEQGNCSGRLLTDGWKRLGQS